MIQEGNVCKCMHGKVGVVTHVNYGCGKGTCRPLYFGRTLNGKMWQSHFPTKLAESIEEYQASGADNVCIKCGEPIGDGDQCSNCGSWYSE